MSLRHLRPSAFAAAAVVVVSAGCFEDAVAPAAPLVDDTPGVTSLESVTVSGTAEYLSTVTVSGGASDVDAVVADPQTGRFSFEVPLALGDNALSVVAADVAGNKSEATKIAIVRQSPRAESVTLTLRDAIITADTGTITVGVDVTNSEPGVDLRQVLATLTIPEDTGFAALPLTFNRVGHTDVVIDGRTVVGDFSVHVEADVADEDGNKAADDVAFRIVPGVPTNADFFTVTTTAPFLAGDPITATYTMADQFGNDATLTAPLQVTVNAPNISIVDDGTGNVEINGLIAAGDYVVRAHLPGSALDDDLTSITIEPNPELAGFNLVLSTNLIAQFGTVRAVTSDGFGNFIDAADVDITVAPANSVSVVGDQVSFDLPGSYSVQACLTASPTLCDTEFISVQGLLDTVPPTITVTNESPTSGSTVVRGQRIVFSVDVTDDRALSAISFVTSFGDNGNCRTTGGPILFAGTTVAENRTFSFAVPNCAIPLDRVSIVVQATDQAGNAQNEANETLSVFDPFDLNVAPDAGGGLFVTTVVGFQDRIDGPTGVAADPVTGTVFVANGNNGNRTNRAVGITIDRVQFDFTDQNGQRIDLRGVRGVATSTTGNVFFGVEETGGGGGGSSGIIRVTPDLQRQIFVSSTTPGGQAEAITSNQFAVEQLTLDDSSATPAVCMVISQQDHVWCHGNLEGTPSRLAEVEINGQRPVALAVDAPGPAATDTDDVLFVGLNTSRLVRPFAFNAGRTTLSAVGGGDIDLSGSIGANQMGNIAVSPLPGDDGVHQNLYVADTSGQVLKIDRSTQPPTVSVFIDNIESPNGLAFDGESLIITDDQNRVVFRIIPDAANPGQF